MDQVLIVVHASLGGLALLAGMVALASRKGASRHILSGKVFFWAMLASALLALVIACLPGHQNRFLFAIGLFTTYLLLSGYRAVSLKGNVQASAGDWTLSGAMVLAGSGMVIYGLSLFGAYVQDGIIQLVFGSLGLIFGLQDLQYYRKPGKKPATYWLRRHLGRMSGGYIAAFTAFVVVNDVLPTLWAFLAPTAAGSLFIAYWIRRVRLGKL